MPRIYLSKAYNYLTNKINYDNNKSLVKAFHFVPLKVVHALSFVNSKTSSNENRFFNSKVFVLTNVMSANADN